MTLNFNEVVELFLARSADVQRSSNSHKQLTVCHQRGNDPLAFTATSPTHVLAVQSARFC